MEAKDELLPETYFKMKHPDDVEAVNRELKIEVGEEHLEEALAQIVPSISLQELKKYEELRDKYSATKE